MSQVLEDLVDLLTLEPIEENLFRGRSQDLGFRQLFGGQVLGQSLSRRVVTAARKRMAAADPPEATQCAANSTIFSDRLDQVLAARGPETAIVPQQRADTQLVPADQAHQDDGRQAAEPIDQPLHSLLCASWRATRRAN